MQPPFSERFCLSETLDRTFDKFSSAMHLPDSSAWPLIPWPAAPTPTLAGPAAGGPQPRPQERASHIGRQGGAPSAHSLPARAAAPPAASEARPSLSIIVYAPLAILNQKRTCRHSQLIDVTIIFKEHISVRRDGTGE